LAQRRELPTPDTELSETRLRMIEAAARVFVEKGYARATTRKLAEAAEVNEVTLFRHFGSKVNLLAAVLEHYSGFSALENLLATLNGAYADDLRLVADHMIRGRARDRDVMRLLHSESHQVPELHQEMAAKMRQRNESFRAYFQRQIERGLIRQGLKAEALGQTFFGMCFSYGNMLHHQLRAGIDLSDSTDEMIAQMVDIFVRGSAR
jgi:AcrR family transcriptional regulator